MNLYLWIAWNESNSFPQGSHSNFLYSATSYLHLLQCTFVDFFAALVEFVLPDSKRPVVLFISSCRTSAFNSFLEQFPDEGTELMPIQARLLFLHSRRSFCKLLNLGTASFKIFPPYYFTPHFCGIWFTFFFFF